MSPVRKQERGNVIFGLLKQFDICRSNPIERLSGASLRLDDDWAISAVVDLTTAVGVIEVATVLIGVPLVIEGLSGSDWSLCESRNSISPRCVSLVDTCRR